MSDALVERLRQYGPHHDGSAFRICDEAADRIEALEKALQSTIRDCIEANRIRAIMEEALREIASINAATMPYPVDRAIHIARAALKEGRDETDAEIFRAALKEGKE